ncbi:MAG: lytic transglycosylase [Gallionellales bacterium GWA2_60_18]|nr:MAG: lytic transglycosylase [Gallionellales bacterium GWA2_60_18]
MVLANPLPNPLPQAGEGVKVPRAALRYQRDLTRNARAVWGMDAPVAVFAAQIHQESRWRADARSVVGAQGIAQFMPATATWISGAYRWGEAQPYNPAWAMRALVTYDRWLWDRVLPSPQPSPASGESAARGAEPSNCERMAMSLSAYNGGLGWVYRDQKLAASRSLNPAIWFGHVEKVNAGRSAANFAENRGYPRVILLKHQPVYANWGGAIACA